MAKILYIPPAVIDAMVKHLLTQMDGFCDRYTTKVSNIDLLLQQRMHQLPLMLFPLMWTVMS